MFLLLILIMYLSSHFSNITPLNLFALEGNNASPLDQFTIRDLISLDLLGSINLSLTNIGLYLVISSLIILTLYLVSNNYNKIVSNN